MDFIKGLPSATYNYILVVVDKYSKYAHFIPLRHPFTGSIVAKVFLDNVYKLHDMPKSIILDRDKIFLSNFWQHLFKLVGVSLHMSSAYHPQSDGQTERINQCLETLLRCFVHYWLSSGTTQAAILLWIHHHLRSCMAILQGTSISTWYQWLQHRTCMRFIRSQ